MVIVGSSRPILRHNCPSIIGLESIEKVDLSEDHRFYKKSSTSVGLVAEPATSEPRNIYRTGEERDGRLSTEIREDVASRLRMPAPP